MSGKWPERLHRLPDYDYSRDGHYFITICTDYKRKILGTVITEPKSVVRGLAPAGTVSEIEPQHPTCVLSEMGIIVENELLGLNDRFPSVYIDHYVIMPNHIHTILELDAETAGASPRTTSGCRETVSAIIGAFKSITTIKIRKTGFKEKVWQEGFYDHIIRGKRDYDNAWNYITDNPRRWAEDKYFTPE